MWKGKSVAGKPNFEIAFFHVSSFYCWLSLCLCLMYSNQRHLAIRTTNYIKIFVFVFLHFCVRACRRLCVLRVLLLIRLHVCLSISASFFSSCSLTCCYYCYYCFVVYGSQCVWYVFSLWKLFADSFHSHAHAQDGIYADKKACNWNLDIYIGQFGCKTWISISVNYRKQYNVL